MSQQYLKISKNSQSATVQQSTNKGEHNYQSYNDMGSGKPASQNLQKGKSEVQTFQSKKLNRRDLNLIPPSAAIV